MSGGFFNYRQYNINDIADKIEERLNLQGMEIPKECILFDDEYYVKYPEEKLYQTFPEVVQEKMKEAVKYLRVATIYAQRVDRYLSGDDSDNDFIKRLDEELKSIELIKYDK